MIRTINNIKIEIELEEHKIFGTQFETFVEHGLENGFAGASFVVNKQLVGKWKKYEGWFNKYYISNFE